MQLEAVGTQTITQTLTIPLLTRARESQSANPIFRDDKAVEVLSQIHVDTIASSGGPVADHGILARTLLLDQEIREYLQQAGRLTILNLGAGLDTRANRLSDEWITWYDLDLPEVIVLRERLFKPDQRGVSIAKSVLDPTWPDEVRADASQPVVILAEGLLMYFSETEVRQIFTLLADRFSGAHVYFDVVHPYFVGKGILSPFRWGLNHPADLQKLDDRICIVNIWKTGDLLRNRQPLVLRCLNVLPATRSRSQIFHVLVR